MTAFGIPSFGIMSFVLISLGLLSFGILSSGLMSVYPDEKCLMVFNCGFMVLQVYDMMLVIFGWIVDVTPGEISRLSY